MLEPTVCHRCWKVFVEPVKWIPERSGCCNATSETSSPSPGSMLTPPGGSPAASNSRIVKCAAYCWVGLGFQMTTFPINAGAVGRLPAIEVKLNGVMAYTKPSRGGEAALCHAPADEIG